MATISDFILKIKTIGKKSIDDLSNSVDNVEKKVNKLNNASTGKLNGTFKNLKDTFSSTASTGSSAADQIIGAFSPLGGPGGIVAGVATAFVGLGMVAINMADQMQDLADATGLTSSEVMSFKASVINAGGDADDFEKILAKMNQSVQEAAAGNGKLQQAFSDLGVSITNSNGTMKSNSVILQEIIQKYKDGEISAKEYAATIDVMGKSVNRLDLTKLDAVNDPFKNEKIQQLADYRTEIDKLSTAVGEGLVISFGALATAINVATVELQNFSNREENIKRMKREVPIVLNRFNQRGSVKKGPNVDRPTAEDQGYTVGVDERPVGSFTPVTPPKLVKPTSGSRSGGRSSPTRDLNAYKETLSTLQNITSEYTKQNKERQDALRFEIDKLNMSEKEIEDATRNRDIERERVKAMTELDNQETKVRNNSNLSGKEKAALLSEIVIQRDEINRRAAEELVLEQATTNEMRNRTQVLGDMNAMLEEQQRKIAEGQNEFLKSDWVGAMKERIRQIGEQMTPENLGLTAIDIAFNGLSDAIDNFVETGKFNFGEFARSIIADLTKMILKALIFRAVMSALGMPYAGMPIGMPGRASGGLVGSGKAYMVGEQGPEMFVPNSNGSIVPNNKLGGQPPVVYNITNNISALDAKSVAQIFVENRKTLLGATNMARKETPYGA